MDYNLLAEKLFPQVTKQPEDIQYPARELPEGAKVTRMDPVRPVLCTLEICMVRW